MDCELGWGRLCLELLHKYAIILSVCPKIPQTNAQQQQQNSHQCSPGVQTAEQDLPLCPCRGARCVSAEILGCLPSPLAELTSASATGMLLSESPVLPRWQKLWIMVSSARDPSVKSPQRPRSSQGDGRDHPAEAWCECLLPLGGTVFQRMPAELPSSGAGRSYQLLFQLPSVGGPRLPNR